MKRLLLALSLLGLPMATDSRAEDEGAPPCCAHCGCRCCLRPCCKIVCEMKEVKEWCYDCKCEDFCVPGRSECVGCHPEQDCCGCCKMKPTYKPCWCDMFCRKKLVKREIVKKVPKYKCVVEYVCADCCGCGGNCGHRHHHHAEAALPVDAVAEAEPVAEPAAPPVARAARPVVTAARTVAQPTAAAARPIVTATPVVVRAAVADEEEQDDLAPPAPKITPVVKRAPTRLLPPPPLPDMDRDPTVHQASHEGSAVRRKLR